MEQPRHVRNCPTLDDLSVDEPHHVLTSEVDWAAGRRDAHELGDMHANESESRGEEIAVSHDHLDGERRPSEGSVGRSCRSRTGTWRPALDHDRWTHRVVEHRREEAALDPPRRIRELGLPDEPDPDPATLIVMIDQVPAEYFRARGQSEHLENFVACHGTFLGRARCRP